MTTHSENSFVFLFCKISCTLFSLQEKSVCMRKENIPIHSEDRVARSKTVSDKNNPGTKSIGSIKGFFLKDGNNLVLQW